MKISTDQQGSKTVLRLEGRLDAAGVRDHRDQLTRLADEVENQLVVNLHGVSFIDSSGLGLIVSMVRRLREHRADMSLCQLTPQAQSLFELTRMSRIFTIYTSEEDALAST